MTMLASMGHAVIPARELVERRTLGQRIWKLVKALGRRVLPQDLIRLGGRRPMLSREARERQEDLDRGDGKQGSWQLACVGPTRERREAWTVVRRAA
jgi:hypothetical protein